MSLNNSTDNNIDKIKQEETSTNHQHETNRTLRTTADAMENILYKQFDVLDHGFVRVVDYMGDDSSVVQAARVSYGRGTKRTSQDKGLIRYLMRHHHTTPFEMCEIKLHVKLPIFVARQWVRHRTANINEYSARYSILDKEFYLPNPEDISLQSSNNKQGRAQSVSREEAARLLQIFESDSRACYDHYSEMLNIDSDGKTIDENKPCIARELARMNLTLNYYTQWYWKIDLNNLLHFLRLRADSHAQLEIRLYADIILEIVKKWVPYTYEAFIDYQLNSFSLSAKAKSVVQKLIMGQSVDQSSSGMSNREWTELQKGLNIDLDNLNKD